MSSTLAVFTAQVDAKVNGHVANTPLRRRRGIIGQIIGGILDIGRDKDPQAGPKGGGNRPDRGSNGDKGPEQGAKGPEGGGQGPNGSKGPDGNSGGRQDGGSSGGIGQGSGNGNPTSGPDNAEGDQGSENGTGSGENVSADSSKSTSIPTVPTSSSSFQSTPPTTSETSPQETGISTSASIAPSDKNSTSQDVTPTPGITVPTTHTVEIISTLLSDSKTVTSTFTVEATSSSVAVPSSLNAGLLGGCVAGAVVVFIMVILALCLWRRRRKRRSQEHSFTDYPFSGYGKSRNAIPSTGFNPLAMLRQNPRPSIRNMFSFGRSTRRKDRDDVTMISGYTTNTCTSRVFTDDLFSPTSQDKMRREQDNFIETMNGTGQTSEKVSRKDQFADLPVLAPLRR